MNVKPHYKEFFLKSEAGKEFMETLYTLISISHERAEGDADKARDYTQQAKGVRQVIEHIQSMTADIKK